MRAVSENALALNHAAEDRRELSFWCFNLGFLRLLGVEVYSFHSWPLRLSISLESPAFSYTVQWILTAPHPVGSPSDNGFVCIVCPFPPPEKWRLFVPWVTMGGTTHYWVGQPLRSTHYTPLQRISIMAVCSRKPARHY